MKKKSKIAGLFTAVTLCCLLMACGSDGNTASQDTTANQQYGQQGLDSGNVEQNTADSAGQATGDKGNADPSGRKMNQ